MAHHMLWNRYDVGNPGELRKQETPGASEYPCGEKGVSNKGVNFNSEVRSERAFEQRRRRNRNAFVYHRTTSCSSTFGFVRQQFLVFL